MSGWEKVWRETDSLDDFWGERERYFLSTFCPPNPTAAKQTAEVA